MIGLLLAVAACGGGGGGSSSSGTSSGTTVNVSEKEWVITVGGTDLQNGNGNASVPTGKVTFDIKNDGSVAHEFEIKGNGIDQKSNSIDPGKTEKLTVNLTAGEYEVWCPVPGHKEAGMDGHVTAS
jgi:iron uptake system EfeUOB component EfeO/EfeM